MMTLTEIERWQMQRLLRDIERERSNIAGFRVQGFYFLNERENVYEALIEHGRIHIKRELDRELANFYRDVWFIMPHIALDVQMEVGELMLVFYADDFDRLKKWLQEKLPNARSLIATERLLAGRSLVG